MGDYRGFSPRKLFQNNKFQKFLIAVFAFIILFFICSKGIIPEKYDFKEGDIAAFDIKAPRDFTNDAETQLNIEKALSGVSDYYDERRVNIKVNAIDKITQYFNKAGEIKSSNYDISTGWQKLQSETSIKLTKEDYIETLKLQDDQIKVLSDFLAKNLSVILSDGIRDKIIDDKKKAEENLNYYIRNDVTLNKSMKELASNIGVILIQPNMFYNQEKTEQYKNDIKRGIEPVIIKKNQNIVAKGQVITSEHLYLMRKAGLLRRMLQQILQYIWA
jgi:membrane-associated HD superfamily phosphohydrolase